MPIRPLQTLLFLAVAATVAVSIGACSSSVETPASSTQQTPAFTSTIAASAGPSLQPPPVTGAADEPDTSKFLPESVPFVVNVSVGDLGISPSLVTVPAGRPVQIVMRNPGLREHRYEIVGLEPEDSVWFTLEATVPQEGSALPDATGGPANNGISAPLDEHEAHHSGAFVPRRFCDVNRGPCGEEGYIQVRAPAGGIGVIMFIPITTGTYAVIDPGRSDSSAKLVVF